MSEFSTYEDRLKECLSLMGWQMEWALFNGMPSSSPIADWLSVCCNADTYVQQRDYYSGDPTCEKCHMPCEVHVVPRVKGVRVA